MEQERRLPKRKKVKETEDYDPTFAQRIEFRVVLRSFGGVVWVVDSWSIGCLGGVLW